MDDMLSELNAPAPTSDLPYTVTGATAPVSGLKGASVGRGVNTKKGLKGGRFVIFTNGTTQQALPVRAVAQAIYSGVITREEIENLWAAADTDADDQEAGA